MLSLRVLKNRFVRKLFEFHDRMVSCKSVILYINYKCLSGDHDDFKVE